MNNDNKVETAVAGLNCWASFATGENNCYHHEKIKFISSNRRVMFCLLYSRKKFKFQVSNINFRSIMVKTWLYFD